MMRMKQLEFGGCWLALACLAAAAPARADLIGFFPLNGGANNLADSANNGTIMGGLTFVDDGVDGKAGRFNGTNAHITTDINMNPDALPQLTMGAWVRIPAGSGEGIRSIIAHDDGGW